MSNTHLPPPDKLNLEGDLQGNWEYFETSWKNYSTATELNKKSEEIQVATLLSLLGREGNEIYTNLPISTEERKKTTTILEKLRAYFVPKQNTIYERYTFNTTSQNESETFDDYLNKLRRLVKTCKYGTLQDEMLRDRLVIGIQNNTVRGRLLRENNLTLDTAIQMCRTAEITTLQLQKIDGDNTEPVHAVKSRNNQRSTQQNHNHESQRRRKNCGYCGSTHARYQCPAYGKTCKNCHKKGHFSEVCRSRQPQTYAMQDQQSDDSEGSLYVVQSVPKRRLQYFAKLDVKQSDGVEPKQLRLQIDSGATCNTLTKSDYLKVCCKPLKPSKAKLRAYNNETIKPIGSIVLKCSTGDITHRVHFEILEDAPVSLLSGAAAEAFNLIKFNEEQLVHSIRKHPLSKSDILKDYKDVFSGLGKLPGVCKISIDPGIEPVKDIKRRISINVKQEFKKKLKELEQKNVIAKVTTPTDWVSNLVVVKRPNKIRICLDPISLNKAVKRSHYPIPTIEDVAPRLTNAKIFSVVDAKDGYLQVELDEESSYLTTFWTNYGRYRWLRMPFGISNASEEFQRRLDECLEGLENIEVIADDIIIYGTGDTNEAAESSHDKAMIALLQRCRERGLKLNESKLKYKLNTVSYMGHQLSSTGISPDPQKIEAITGMPAPNDASAVKRLIGMVTYLAKFVPHLSTLCEPLHRLTDKDADFKWDATHQDTFDKIKSLISQAPVLKYYDSSKPVTIECDSSEYGLGAVLMQENQPICFASRTLTSTERNYAQIEKECLAIVFAAERFDQYILGRDEVFVDTDHKPLTTIFKKSLLSSPKRLQRMRLRLQKYMLNVQYKPGPQMFISDTLSRACLPLVDDNTQRDKSDYIIFKLEEEQKIYSEIAQIDHTNYVHVTDKRLQEIKSENEKDETCQKLAQYIKSGWPDDKSSLPHNLRTYWPYRDELTEQDGILYRGTRIIIPNKLRQTLTSRAHASHNGIQKTLNTAREIMYWPTMNAQITEAVQKCQQCQTHMPSQRSEPMMSYPLPTHPWQIVFSDCFEHNSKHYCVFVDSYSDFFELCALKTMTSSELIWQAKKTFATHGIPTLLVTDNGTNYSSRDFTKFAHEWGFNHVTSSPHHHRSNGKAESAVKIAKSLIKKSSDLWLALLEWRNSPTSSMTTSPVQRLMSRRTRSFLPCDAHKYNPEVEQNVKQQLEAKREKSKELYDKHTRPLPKLHNGQCVTIKTHPHIKNSGWKRGKVIKLVAPRSYIVEVQGIRYRRNRVHIRTISNSDDEDGLSIQTQEEEPCIEVDDNTTPQMEHVAPPNENIPRRSTRVSQPPSRLRYAGDIQYEARD